MRKVIDYCILWRSSGRRQPNYDPSLEDQVKQKIEEGWQPLGGVAVNSTETPEDYSFSEYQAMVKYR